MDYESWCFTNFFNYFCVVNVVSRKTLAEFYKDHADAKEPLETWYRVCKKAVWRNFNEVQKAYPTADVVGDDRVVFNITGNKYRLVVRFSFRYKAIQVKWIGTHAGCDDINVLEV
jgi:mRNA interferase HigB